MTQQYEISDRAAPSLTAEKYCFSRDSGYGHLEPADIAFFQEVLASEDSVSTDDDVLLRLNTDYGYKHRGQSTVVLKPSTTKEVSAVLKYCNERRLAVVPQGGKTGCVAGSVPVFDEVIVSLEKLSRIRTFDPLSGILTTDAGVILQTADRYLQDKGYIFPLDLALKGECQIGGNISTNAGGLRVLKYGSLHGSVLGIEAVLANGEIYDGLSALRKDNTGYDLKQLFIGAEGTLGIVTAVSILAAPKPKSVHVAIVGVKNTKAVTEVFAHSRQNLAELLSAYECIDDESLRLTERTHNLKQQPLKPIFQKFSRFSLVIETSGSNAAHDLEKLDNFGRFLKNKSLVETFQIAQNQQDIDNVWKWREMVPKLSSYWGGCYAYDVSLPVQSMWELVSLTKQRINDAGLLSDSDSSKPVVDVIGYGHIGDGNIHLNVVVRNYDTSVESVLEPFVYDFVAAKKGSIAAEHGIGLQKLEQLKLRKSPLMLKLMQAIKSLYDPKWILNPYKVIEKP